MDWSFHAINRDWTFSIAGPSGSRPQKQPSRVFWLRAGFRTELQSDLIPFPKPWVGNLASLLGQHIYRVKLARTYFSGVTKFLTRIMRFSRYFSRAAKRQGFKRGGSRSGLILLVLSFFCPAPILRDFPDLSQFVLFVFLGPLAAPMRNSPERARPRHNPDLSRKSGKPPGFGTPVVWKAPGLASPIFKAFIFVGLKTSCKIPARAACKNQEKITDDLLQGAQGQHLEGIGFKIVIFPVLHWKITYSRGFPIPWKPIPPNLGVRGQDFT